MRTEMPFITGTTRFIAMLGDPVKQVKTPAAFNAFAAEAGLDIITLPINVQAETLAKTLEALRGFQNCAGAIVTYPHKAAALQAVQTSDEIARLVGACNVIRRDNDGQLHGGMTDGRGFVAALRSNGVDPRGRDIRLIGIGGAGSAIAAALAEAGVKRIVVHDLDDRRTAALAQKFRKIYPDTSIAASDFSDFDPLVVVNATPVGMNGDPNFPYPLDGLTPDCLIADIVPTPVVTAWLEKARSLGHQIQTGPEMVANQLGAVVRHILPELTADQMRRFQ
ncbi:shikimate dehydrogenase [Fulvimarina sp. 2208YS6-2-32]|uniref:Shikimate dehydrogenase n=1 Tax=Fulvimarina uroteuthidis TaxID=3098149 RepID=A0ABU5I030_9HYPH|nr:shikimate dehydrogenase [Fulvimarina sp. 2208YS6-2-32]MDY8108734.1 shikimate dehydrogenase [Fulvimarina sp. 2208YS6-2-32]